MPVPYRLRPAPTCLQVLLLLLPLWLVACTPTVGSGEFNATTRMNDLNETLLADSPIKTVVIANVNIGTPSRNYLDKEAQRVDNQVAQYLTAQGYKVVSPREFSQRWENAKLTYGDPVDPTTGRVNNKTFSQIMLSIRDQMRSQSKIDAFVFTDLIELEVTVSGGMNHVARFDGVTRKPSLRGTGNGITSDFDWGRPAAAVSIQIAIFNMELQQVFAGVGGIDLTDAIDTRSGNSYIRRRDVLENDDYILEGVQLALHPLVAMKNWPGQP